MNPFVYMKKIKHLFKHTSAPYNTFNLDRCLIKIDGTAFAVWAYVTELNESSSIYSPVAKPHAMTITANDRSMVNLAAVQSAGDLAVRHKVANPVPYKAYTQSLLIVGMCLSIENYV